MFVLLLFPWWITVLILLDVCFILYAIDDDDETWGTAATISVLFVLGLLEWLTSFKPFTFIKDNPLPSLLLGIGYFIAGAVWSVVKWWFAEKARVRRAKRDHGEKYRNSKTQTVKYKSTVLVWIGYWPFSLVWTLLSDPFKRLVCWIYDELLHVYQRITDSAWN
jgi:hypothetical protein